MNVFITTPALRFTENQLTAMTLLGIDPKVTEDSQIVMVDIDLSDEGILECIAEEIGGDLAMFSKYPVGDDDFSEYQIW